MSVQLASFPRVQPDSKPLHAGRLFTTKINPPRLRPNLVFRQELIEAIAAADWSHSYSREEAAFPLPFVRANKFWPSVGRIDNPYGDRNLFCSCPPVEAFA